MAYYLMHNGQPSARRLLKRISELRSYRRTDKLHAQDVVIRWGDVDLPDPPNVTVWNAKSSVTRTSSRSHLARLLRPLGVRFSGNGQTRDGRSFIRNYRIPIFDMTPLTCYRSDGSAVWLNQRIQRVQETFRQIPIDEDKLTIRVVNYALRTLHALGLDFGLVSIGMGQKGVLYVQDVVATPVLDGTLMDLYVTAIENRIALDSDTSNNSIQIGADVEMMLQGPQGKMVLASNFLTRKGRVGCDDRSIQFDGKRLPLVELRPDPASSPMELLDNLREAMEEALARINRHKVIWKAGSMPFRPYCTGGHIHFSGVPYTHQFVRVLDNYVGLPLMLVEDQGTSSLRRPRYGFLGDVRHKDYGGFEYRTPASFIVDETVTTAAFCLAYIVAIHHKELPTSDLYNQVVQDAFYKGDVSVLRPIVEQNLRELAQVETYELYRQQLEPFFSMIREGRTWNESRDVREVWGLQIPVKVRRVVTRRRAPHRLTV